MRMIDADALKEEFAKHEDRKGYLIGDWEEIIDNAPTVEYPEAITIKCVTEEEKQKLLSALRNARLTICEEAENEHL